jgi:prepilin-type N-terminal cleavage/methylation domain-containing protein
MRKHSSRGYTAIEVLISIAVFGVGAAGVIAMQRASVQGNYDARSLDIANNILREWQERLHRDATLWTSPSNPPGSATTWLDGATAAPAWQAPPYPPTNFIGASPAFDMLGRDLPSSVGTNPLDGAAFCVQVRLTTLPPSTSVVRAETRVVWLRNGGTFACLNAIAPAFAPESDPARFRILNATTVLRGRFQGNP